VPAFMSEDDLEQYAIGMFLNLGYEHLHGSVIAPYEIAAERTSFRDSVLRGRLVQAVRRLNTHLPAAAVDSVVRKVLIPETTALVLNNRRFHSLLIDGVPVEYSDTGGTVRYDRAILVDFDEPDNNDWLVVNQFTIKEDSNERRPDLLVFINGLPIGIFEFKNPADEKATIRGAFNQLETYKADVPGLLAYNEILVIADGTLAKVGSLTADWERYSEWKQPDGQRPPIELVYVINEIFDKARLLDIIRYFSIYDVAGTQSVKILAAYHQYYAVNKAIERTIQASAEGADQRIGVFWHTQGAGKSYSMTFYAGKIVQQPELKNPTLVVVTDRNDLDEQLFEQFLRCKDALRQEPEEAKDRDDLRDRLQAVSGHIIFTTIQKFQLEKDEKHYPKLTDRHNVIVMADEAHRSQYGLLGKVNEKTGETTYGFARNLHDALPNSLHIGFTGTPVEKGDHNTRAVFGPDVDSYDIKRAVADGATVPLYYEARIAKLNLKPEEIPKIDPAFEEITEGQEDQEKGKYASRWSQIEVLVGADKRIDSVAKDFVAHFQERQKSFDFPGKVMIVCMSRRICAKLYAAITLLRPDWHDPADDKGVIKVVMTGSAADKPELQPHIRNKAGRRLLAKRFKDPANALQIVIVRDMWLTGFDVKPLHTMYIDKPMKGHGLMQAIARANRVFQNKPGGLIVDYIGISRELKAAMVTYIESGGKGEAYFDLEKAISQLQKEYEIVRDMYHGFPYQQYIEGNAEKKLLGLNKAADFILGPPDGRSRYLLACARLSTANTLASSSDYAKFIDDEVSFFKGVRATIVKATPTTGKTVEDVELALQQLVSSAVASQGIVDVLDQAGIKRPDISVFSDEFLAELQGLEQKNLAQAMLQRLLQDEISVRAKRNLVQARKFSEMLNEAVQRYDSRAITTVEMIEKLIEFAKELRDDPKRAEQLGLSEDEMAFYDALASSESAVEVLGDAQLRAIARDLVKKVREKVTVDWNLRESIKAGILLSIKQILRKHGYPPDKSAAAAQQVLDQAILLCHVVAA
jgi:type I restriction enzyme R subunit